VLDSVSVILLQVYTLLVCAFITMIRKQLSVADAHFAITSTVTPLSVYLLYASFRKILRKPSYLFRRLGNQPTTTYAVLSLAMLPMWIIMDGLIYFSNDFANSDCPHISFVSWIMYRMAASIFTFVYSLVFIAFILLIWIVYLLRHIRDIRDEYRRHKMNAQRWKYLPWLQWFPLWFKSLTLAQWDVIMQSHPWLLTFTIGIIFFIWGCALMLYVPDLSKFYYELVQQLQQDSGVTVTSPGPYTPPSGYDPLDFGQLLAAAVAFPPLWQLLTLIWTNRGEILKWIKGYPRSLWNGIVFIFTGHRNPWKKVLADRAEEGRTGHTAGPGYDSIPFTGPVEAAHSDEEKYSLSNPAWKSIESSTTLYDPYAPKS